MEGCEGLACDWGFDASSVTALALSDKSPAHVSVSPPLMRG